MQIDIIVCNQKTNIDIAHVLIYRETRKVILNLACLLVANNPASFGARWTQECFSVP